MSDEKKTLGQVYFDASFPADKWLGVSKIRQQEYDLLGAGIAAVCRAVMAESATPSQLEHAKRLADRLDAAREANKSIQAHNAELVKERDAAVAEWEQLRKYVDELLMKQQPQPAATPTPPAATGEDLIDAVEVGIDGWVKREYLAQCRMSVLEKISPLFDAVRAERDRAIEADRTAVKGQLPVVCTKCFYTPGTNRSKYCGDGGDKDNGHRWTKVEELVKRAEAAEAELAKRPDERSCLAALMAISELLGIGGIVNPGDTVKAVEVMKGERDKLAAELAIAVSAIAWADTHYCHVVANNRGVLAAFRATKGKEQGDAS